MSGSTMLSRGRWQYLVLVAGLLACELASAQALGGTLSKGLESLISVLQGPIAKSLAILAVMGFGIGALTGRVDWIRALLVVMAIGVIFSAPYLVGLFSDGAAS